MLLLCVRLLGQQIQEIQLWCQGYQPPHTLHHLPLATRKRHERLKKNVYECIREVEHVRFTHRNFSSTGDLGSEACPNFNSGWSRYNLGLLPNQTCTNWTRVMYIHVTEWIPLDSGYLIFIAIASLVEPTSIHFCMWVGNGPVQPLFVKNAWSVGACNPDSTFLRCFTESGITTCILVGQHCTVL